MSKLLTKTEIGRLTGAGADNIEEQKRILDTNRIPYVRRKDGSPALTWEMVNQAKIMQINTPGTGGATSLIPSGVNMGAING
ncbi:DUF4224 domain-containing protein [Microbulbifer sp. OS29]|uniref:DUF4224 domain-containing protein n=1 Tax=Microbulbifer okhotskensis TaxID=2926617 RepID=A0A9X2J855_9GAMM|nr:DUF4224 domain-containing protein [Microbulbifer okhotskensis]MCO1336510.1 DUF4224 domain-containing protein [Microbulbifer okhotskensis]